ncbi:hypothetical protein D3C72_1607040 [compost metagenome]
MLGGFTVVDDLLRDGVARQQLLRARIGLGGGIKLGLALFHYRQRRGLFRLPLGDKAVGRIDCYFRTAELCFGLTLPRFQLGGVHLRQHLPGLHEIAFAHHDVLKAAGGFGGNIDLDRLDPAVAGRETGRQPLPLQLRPGKVSGNGNNQNHQTNEQAFFRHPSSP